MLQMFGDLTRDELSLVASHGLAIVPLGSTEQHGHHLPVHTDSFLATCIAKRVAEKAPDDLGVVVCPTVPYGYAEHHLPFGGTLSVDMNTYVALLVSLGRSLAVSGFRKVLFLNGHGGNINPAAVAVDRLVTELKLEMAVGVVSYWDCGVDDVIARYPLLRPAPGHAGNFEASLLWHLDPGSARRSSHSGTTDHPIATVDDQPGVRRFPGIWQDSDGVTDDAHHADPEQGGEVLKGVTEALVQYVVDFSVTADRQLTSTDAVR